MTLASLRAAFASVYPQDDAMLNLYENNHDFLMETIASRHRWAAFRAGASATISNNDLGDQLDQLVYAAERVYAGMVDHCLHTVSIQAPELTTQPESYLLAHQPAQVGEKRPDNCGTGFCSCIECPYPTAKQPLTEEKLKEFLIDIYIANTEYPEKTKLKMAIEVARLVEKHHGIGNDQVSDGWVEIKLPEDRQIIEGKASVYGPVWTEDYDKNEPLSNMRFWRPALDLNDVVKEVDQCNSLKIL